MFNNQLLRVKQYYLHPLPTFITLPTPYLPHNTLSFHTFRLLQRFKKFLGVPQLLHLGHAFQDAAQMQELGRAFRSRFFEPRLPGRASKRAPLHSLTHHYTIKIKVLPPQK